ncbi:hypothetical protein yaldo0001_450 [Yersinia aldovae ATCC 35236]|nr:hypothetical protein yaldo0001_450 [Yersinia aldovae ATCC 35236]
MWFGTYHARHTLSVISEYDDSLICYSQLYFDIFSPVLRMDTKISIGWCCAVAHLMDNKLRYRIAQKQKTPRLSVAFFFLIF